MALWLCLPSTALPAEKLQTYTSPDGVFRFQYSPVLARTTTQPTAGGDICGDLGAGETIIACFAYPQSRLKDKPTFDAAAAFVAELNEPEKGCLEGSRDWNVEQVQTTNINGVAFKLFHASDAWTGHTRDEYFYRVFHNSKCYELSLQYVNASPGAFDPGIKLLTRQDWKDIKGRLKQIVRSFRFLR
jgi:hypothetical protein